MARKKNRRNVTKGNTAMAKATKALHMVGQIKAMAKPELKYQDYTPVNFSQASNTWETAIGGGAPFAGIVQDFTDKGGRMGDQIYAQRYSATIRLKLPQIPPGEPDPSTYAQSVSVRFVLVRLKHLTGSGTLATNEVWQDDNISSYLSWDRRYNLTKLWDKTIQLTRGGIEERTVKIYKKIRSKVQFVNGGQAVLKNQLLLYVIGDETAVDEVTSPYYRVSARVTYTDS